MTYHDQWATLSSRIKGLAKAGELNAAYLQINSSDSSGRQRYLYEQVINVRELLRDFRDNFKINLPQLVLDAIDRFMEISLINCASITEYQSATTGPDKLWATLTMLISFEAEMTYLLSDNQQHIRGLSERAFAHLQRSIVADSSIRDKWKEAFNAERGEEACERLGAVHLLQHGIFAFKSYAIGERTDLVFQDPVKVDDAAKYSEGLVLTEWKICKDEKESLRICEEAYEQARAYAAGSLSGIELTSYRYLVIVSKKKVKLPEDKVENGTTYKFINIAVDPDTPSTTSKKSPK